MRIACIVLKNSIDGLSAFDYLSVTEVFSEQGYPFEEVRFISRDQSKAFAIALTDLKRDAENVIVIAEEKYLEAVREEILSVLGNVNFRADKSGAATFSEGNFSLFLLSDGEGKAGAEYAAEECIAHLNGKYSTRFDRLVLRTVGAPDDVFEKLVAQAKKIGGNRLSYRRTRKYAEDIFEIVYDSNVPRMLSDDILRIFVQGLDEWLYSIDGTPLEVRLVQLLKIRGKKISVAESFTGGGVGRRIVSVPGASEVYFEGLNTYDEEAKIKRLGVQPYILKTLGAVSDETAYEMAAGLIQTGDCDVSIATTGLAGPKSDRHELPVGLCYIAIGTKEKVFVYRFRFDGTREEITEKAISHALFLAYKKLKD